MPAAASTGEHPWASEWPHPDTPVLMPHGGGGNDRHYNMGLFLWPLPPPGAMSLVCEWRAQGIPLTEHSIDAELIVNAASAARPIWAEPPSTA